VARRAARAGRRVVLTNGVFDLLHTGHLYLSAAGAALGDALFIALNADASVRALKGPAGRCRTRSSGRMRWAALACVDAVVIFRSRG
jgi:cytidyltransferase-like protein